MAKQSRWAKMSESLLHNDAKTFLKKNIPSPKTAANTRNPRQVLSSKKCFAFVDIDSDNEEEFNKEMMMHVKAAPK